MGYIPTRGPDSIWTILTNMGTVRNFEFVGCGCTYIQLPSFYSHTLFYLWFVYIRHIKMFPIKKMDIIFTCHVRESVFWRQGCLWETCSNLMWASCKVEMILEQYGPQWISPDCCVCLPRLSDLIAIYIISYIIIAYFVQHCAMNAETNIVMFLNVT